MIPGIWPGERGWEFPHKNPYAPTKSLVDGLELMVALESQCAANPSHVAQGSPTDGGGLFLWSVKNHNVVVSENNVVHNVVVLDTQLLGRAEDGPLLSAPRPAPRLAANSNRQGGR